jgi:hypothetical protein
MDPVQILLFIVVSVLTGLLVAVGIQAFLILQDFKKSVNKLNAILEDTHTLTNSVARPISGFTNFVEGAKNIRHLLDTLTGHKEKEGLKIPQVAQEENSPDADERSFSYTTQEKAVFFQEPSRRVFHRGGKPLTS